MTITTCQKVTLISCSVLCVSLFLPRMLLPQGKTEKGQPEVGPGFYPSVTNRFSVPDDPEQWDVDLSPSFAHTVEAMVKVKSMERGRKYNLMAKVIPIYGFGILLYILYIIHKLSFKEKMNKSGIYSVVKMTNIPNTTSSDYELARLQQRLLQAEMMMESIVSGKGRGSSRRRKTKSSTSKKEEKLLRQLRQISLLIQEGQLEGASPEMEAEEVPYGADWEGYPEETYPQYDPSYRHRFERFRLEEPPVQPTAEALAERMEQEEEEIMARKLSIVQEEDEEEEGREEEHLNEGEELDEGEEDMEGAEEGIKEEEDEEEDEEEEKKQLLSPAPSAAERKQKRVGLEVSRELQRHSGEKKQISFSDHRHVFHYPKEETFEEEEEREGETEDDDEGTEVEEEEAEAAADDDPLTEAESLQFSCEGSSNPEEEAEEEAGEYLLTLALEENEGLLQADKTDGQSGLRMRNRRGT